MSEKTFWLLLAGVMIGLTCFAIVYALTPGINQTKIDTCRFAGYDTAVTDTDYTLYCVNLESLRPLDPTIETITVSVTVP